MIIQEESRLRWLLQTVSLLNYDVMCLKRNETSVYDALSH